MRSKIDPEMTPKRDHLGTPPGEGPGGPKPYKTNENDPRETCGARRTESAGLRVAMWLPNSSDHKTNPIESTIFCGRKSALYDEAFENSAYTCTNTIPNNTTRITMRNTNT